jgi:hypothetical protein
MINYNVGGACSVLDCAGLSAVDAILNNYLCNNQLIL